ncbi:MAG: PIN domain-containing protein [Proteobacteria bacterium]|nr:PIN domain-containing protein [Pseudomonadota bacterium]
MNLQIRFLLDTNILSDLARNPQGAVAEEIIRRGENSICTSIFVASELRFGALKSGSDRLQSQVDSILSALEIIPITEPADRNNKVALYVYSAGNDNPPGLSLSLALNIKTLKANTGQNCKVDAVMDFR